jgi:WD40 repeat protein
VNEDRLRELLRDRPIPEERAAQSRAWRVVRAAFEDRDRSPAPTLPRRRARLALALAAVIVLAAALALTPAGAKVGDLISDVIEPGREGAEPVLTSLPTDGRLLVESASGPWIVQPDGSKRLLGAYDQAAWSPGGLFVATARGRELTAVVGDPSAVGEPAGTVRWSLARPQVISDPAWAPSGFRVAYRSGASLRVVAGDGTSDRALDEQVARTAPAWRPGERHVLAYTDRDGRVRVVDVDSGKELWSTAELVGTAVEGLDWSHDGRRLLVLTDSFFTVLDADGQPLVKGATDGRAQAAAFSPDSYDVALIRTEASTRGGRSELVLLAGRGDVQGERRLFDGPGRFTDVTWSPDGEWLLLAWRDADQWLFIRPSDEKPVAVSNISRQFDPAAAGTGAFPRVSGWCCAP